MPQSSGISNWNPRELVDEAEATIEAGQGEVFEKARHPQIEDGMVEPMAAWRP